MGSESEGLRSGQEAGWPGCVGFEGKGKGKRAGRQLGQSAGHLNGVPFPERRTRTLAMGSIPKVVVVCSYQVVSDSLRPQDCSVLSLPVANHLLEFAQVDVY